MGRHLVCTAKMSGISTTIKVYEPMDTVSKGNRKGAIPRIFQGGQDALKPFKVCDFHNSRNNKLILLQEFYVPAEATAVNYLKSKLCVACVRGFEVVSLETLETQPLLDLADTSLDFVTRKDNMPISIERLNGEFLLHYSEFSFFVNRNGWRARPDWLISWEGKPVSFALSHPYLLAFDPSFIEIRHLETSVLVHIITGKNIRMLHSSTREVFPPNRPFTIPLQCLITVLRSYTPTKKTTAKTSSQASTSGPSPHRNNTSSRPRKPPPCPLSPSPKTRSSASRAFPGPGQPNPLPNRPLAFSWSLLSALPSVATMPSTSVAFCSP
jgi:hypothetical protein